MASNKFAKRLDPVSEDRNWVGLIKNELKCAELWDKDWGFLAGDADLKKENATKLYTIDDKIKAVQDELERMQNVKVWSTTSGNYGNRTKIEMFESKDNNISKNPELMPLSRKLPKTWKKGKFTPPVDEFDPLKNTYKKK